jgi:putative nicotinate phosphoribosyltransferase
MPLITEKTLDYLKDFSFKGTISGYTEGDVYFPFSPILTVAGTFAECILLETVILSILNHDSAVGSAASRMANAAGGIPLIEMGSRRTHELAAVDAARMAYIAGFKATSNLAAGEKYGITTIGTSAHAFTLAHRSEKEAFKAQIDSLGVITTLLVDTYDIEQGIRNAIEVAGPHLGAIRIDSGDLVEETFKARKLLDELGATATRILLSSDMDEFIIDKLTNEVKAPVDGIGVGTQLVTGSGHPTASMVYKLVEINGKPVAKKADGKISVGGEKFVWREFDADGLLTGEYFTLNKKHISGKRTQSVQRLYAEDGEYFIPTLDFAREHHSKTMKILPEHVKAVAPAEAFLICLQREENNK